MRLTLGMDVGAACGEAVSGVGYHIIRLLERLDAQSPADWRFKLVYELDSPDAAGRAAERLPRRPRFELIGLPVVTSRIPLIGGWLSGRARARSIAELGCRLFHGPAHKLPRGLRGPGVVTIHDMAFFRFDLYEQPYLGLLRDAVRRSLRDARAVISLSQSTARDIEEFTGRTRDVHVIYGAGNYADEARRATREGDAPARERLGVRSRYVFYVGDFGPRKNLPYLVESFARLRTARETSDVQLVLAGNSKNAKESLLQTARDHGLPEGAVVFPGRVSDEDLATLYRGASAFALASLAEGFTLVTLEAMSYGVPVVATDTTSIAEGTGDAAELAPLDEPEAFAACLRTALTPGPRRDEMRAKGFERIKLFTWEENARRTIEVYRAAAG
jgi:glycosyltransferase involved in cell wall biosynthesis